MNGDYRIVARRIWGVEISIMRIVSWDLKGLGNKDKNFMIIAMLHKGE